MSREQWSFQIPVGDVRNSIHDRIEYHTDRLGYWNAQLEISNDQLRDSGIQIREQQFTGCGRLEATFDQTIGNRINECNRKITHHKRKLLDYQAFHVGLNFRSSGELLALNAYDILWSGLAEQFDPEES